MPTPSVSRCLALTMSLLMGCGGPLGGEPQGPEVPAETEQPSEDTEAKPQAFMIVPPGATLDVPSHWLGETRIFVQGHGDEFQSVGVHMWCTTGNNDAYYRVEPGQTLTFRWTCRGRRIWVHSLGTGYNQDLQVATY
jgi:hypothetical protein